MLIHQKRKKKRLAKEGPSSITPDMYQIEEKCVDIRELRSLRIVHELHGRPRGVRHEGLLLQVDGAGLVGHVLEADGGEVGAVALGRLGAVEQGRAAAPRLARDSRGAAAGAVGRADWGLNASAGVVVQLGECVGEVLSVDQLVRCVLKSHLPTMGRRGGRGNKEELAGVGQGEVAVLRVDGGRGAEVDTAGVAEDSLAVPDLAHGYGGVVIKEGDDDAAEGLERGPCVDGSGLGDEIADGLQIVGAEDVEILQVGEEQGVGRRGGLDERWEG